MPPFESPNFLSIGRIINGTPAGGSSTVIGQGFFNLTEIPLCFPLSPAMDNSNKSVEGPASLPDGKCVLVSNDHPTLPVYIKFWDEGDGEFEPSGYPFACNGTGIPDYALGPGEEVILQRQGNIIQAVMSCAAPIPTLGEWGLIILGFSCLIFGIMSIRSKLVAEI